MDLSLISKYRTQLMGIAIIWVMLFHSGIFFSSPVLMFIKKIGFGGVDIFIFLSGLGIFFSLDKNDDIKNFYKKRAFRILPYYIPIVVIVSLYYYFNDKWDFIGVVSNIFMLSYWLDLKERFDWYIPALFVLYLCSPFIFKFLKKNIVLTSSIIIAFCIIIWYFIYGTRFSYLTAFFARIPLFIMGMCYANYYKNNLDKKFNGKQIILLLSYFVCCVGILIFLTRFRTHSDNYLIFFNLTIPCICLFVAYLFSFLKNYRYPVLTFMGTYTLTLYIFHERVLQILSFNGFYYHLNLVAFVLTIFLAFVWKKTVDKLMNRYFD